MWFIPHNTLAIRFTYCLYRSIPFFSSINFPSKISCKEEKVNPKLTAYQVELAQVEAEIEKLLDTLTGANATLLALLSSAEPLTESQHSPAL